MANTNLERIVINNYEDRLVNGLSLTKHYDLLLNLNQLEYLDKIIK